MSRVTAISATAILLLLAILVLTAQCSAGTPMSTGASSMIPPFR